MDSYSVSSELDRGTFGVVHLVRRKRDGRVFVMKRMDLRKASQKRARYYYNEVQLLSKLHHPNIVTYVDSFHAEDHLCIVMEYYKDGNLGSLIDQQREQKETLSEEVVLTIFTQILFGVYFLHRKDIIHRDLKPKNIFINDTVVVVGDLGISKALESVNDFAKTFCGTPNYIAPELFLRQKYTKKVDVWSLGCILYEMVALRQAFGEQSSIQVLQRQILTNRYKRLPRGYSQDMCKLVDDLLQVSAKNRPTVGEVLQRPFIQATLNKYVGGLSNNMTYLQVENARKLGGELGITPIVDGKVGNGLAISFSGSESANSKPDSAGWGKNKFKGRSTSDSERMSTEDEPLLAAKKYILDETNDGAGCAVGGGSMRGSTRRRGGAVWPSLRAALLASIAALNVGINLGFAESAMAPMEWGSDPVFSCNGWVSSYGAHRCVWSYEGWASETFFFTAALLGTLISIKLTDWFGRRRMIYACTLLQLAGWCPLLVYDDRRMLVTIGRSVLGLSVGCVCVAAPAYFAEIAPEAHRGCYVALFPLQMMMGMLGASMMRFLFQKEVVVSFEMNQNNPPDFIHTVQWECQWRRVVIGAFIAAASLLVFLGCVPESPRWLKAQGQVWTAVHELQRLGNVIDSVALQRLGQTTPPLSPTTKSLRAGGKGSGNGFGSILCGRSAAMALMGLLALSGFLAPYDALSFHSPLETDLEPPAASAPASLPRLGVLCGILALIGTCLSAALADTVGRRALLLASLSAMALSAGVVSLLTSSWTAPLLPGYHFETGSSFAMTCAALYVFGYGLGLAAIPWVLAAEATSQRLRPCACAAAAFGFLLAESIGLQYHMLRESMLSITSSTIATSSSSSGQPFLPSSMESSVHNPYSSTDPLSQPDTLSQPKNAHHEPLSASSAWIAASFEMETGNLYLLRTIGSLIGLVAVALLAPELKGIELDQRNAERRKKNKMLRGGKGAGQGHNPASNKQPRLNWVNNSDAKAEAGLSPLDEYQVTRGDEEGGLRAPEPMWRT
mmetsp:Transcript_1073/g.2085  ORF Transcript_1073/g.2085 Transcript_1073/m.2085 type:complete len:1014 (-) Transcript_1073:76-3117(-)